MATPNLEQPNLDNPILMLPGISCNSSPEPFRLVLDNRYPPLNCQNGPNQVEGITPVHQEPIAVRDLIDVISD